MNNIPQSVPSENLEIYALLFQFEVGLREYLIETLEGADGPLWWKGRLPPDVKEHFLDGRKYELGISWSRLIPHHPIYYINFTDLKKIVERRDTWREAFQPLFRSKELLMGHLTRLEPIRNSVAHNRRTGPGDLDIVRGALQVLRSALGTERFEELIARCTSAEDIPVTLDALHEEVRRTFAHCMRVEQLPELTAWERVRASWWFDEEYLANDVESITEYFIALAEYSDLPRIRGSGSTIESWLRSSKLQEKYDHADLVLNTLGGD